MNYPKTPGRHTGRKSLQGFMPTIVLLKTFIKMHLNSIFSRVDPHLWGFLYVRTWGLAWVLAMELEMTPEVDKEVLRTGEGNSGE